MEGTTEDYETVRAIWGPVAAWRPQTAAYAEHAAMHVAAQFMPQGPLTVVADCASVIAAARNGREWATEHRRPVAHLWVTMTPHQLTVEKTKAHRSLGQAREAGDIQAFWGNDAADVYAKKAARLNQLTPDELREHLPRQKSRRIKLRNLRKILGQCLPAPRQTPRDRKGPGRKTQDKAARVLGWQPGKDPWACCNRSKNLSTKVKAARGACPGLPAKCLQNAEAAEQNGHRIYVCSIIGKPQPFFYCNKCGVHWAIRATGVHKPCQGENSNSKHRLRKNT
jgi:hypothetical protein